MEQRLTEAWAVRQQWLQYLERYNPFEASTNGAINTLFILLNVVESGPTILENAADYNARIELCHRLFRNQRNVVGRLQEECEPRNDAGHDEDWPRRADERPRLRSRREAIQNHGISSESIAERSEGVPRQPTGNDRIANEDSRDNRRILRRRGHQRWCLSILQAGSRGPGCRDDQSPGRAIQSDSPGADQPVLRVLPGHQRMHQETQQQAPRLRFHAVQGQETGGETRQRRNETAASRERGRNGETSLRATERATTRRTTSTHRHASPIFGPQF